MSDTARIHRLFGTPTPRTTPELYREPLRQPRFIHVHGGRPAMQVAWIIDHRGRRMWAEVVERTQFVRPEDIDCDPNDA